VFFKEIAQKPFPFCIHPLRALFRRFLPCLETYGISKFILFGLTATIVFDLMVIPQEEPLIAESLAEIYTMFQIFVRNST
jgi:hypothetical protein